MIYELDAKDLFVSIKHRKRKKISLDEVIAEIGAHVVDGSDATEMDRALVTALQTNLDEGETEAIALAIEVGADLFLLDERRVRSVASSFGLHFVGLLGVLIEAKHKGYISGVKSVLDDLIAKAGFWVSRQLYARVLEAAGE